eukprot:3023087-Amphidinium_carterae.2
MAWLPFTWWFDRVSAAQLEAGKNRIVHRPVLQSREKSSNWKVEQARQNPMFKHCKCLIQTGSVDWTQHPCVVLFAGNKVGHMRVIKTTVLISKRSD